MLNIMIIEGYVNAEPKIMTKEGKKEAMIKFRIATLNTFVKSSKAKYMWVDCIVFTDKQSVIDFYKSELHRDDYVSAIGGYSYQNVNGKYFAQMVVHKIDKKFASGNVPAREIVENGQQYEEDDEGVNW